MLGILELNENGNTPICQVEDGFLSNYNENSEFIRAGKVTGLPDPSPSSFELNESGSIMPEN